MCKKAGLVTRVCAQVWNRIVVVVSRTRFLAVGIRCKLFALFIEAVLYIYIFCYCVAHGGKKAHMLNGPFTSLYFIHVKINLGKQTTLNMHAIYKTSLTTPHLSLKLILAF